MPQDLRLEDVGREVRMSLRERLEAKARRRLSVPVLVSDPSQDQAELNTLFVALSAAKGRDDEDAAALLLAQVEDQTEKVQSHWALVWLQSLPKDVWREVNAAWQTVETTEDGPEVVTNWDEALAPLIAESCEDPDLQDEKWWSDQLAKPGWSEGDTNAFKLALLRLNVDAADPQTPKD
jgi:hypothetical protein